MDKIEPHQNAVIGMKKLSPADLGSSANSHQTHIGLFESTLFCIDDLHLVDFCYLITDNKIIKLLCLLDYIENLDGTFRSPKIRKGSNEELNFDGQHLNSVVREIRRVVDKTKRDNDWYLLWFASNNRHLIFFLIEFRSELFDLLSSKLHGIKQRQQFESDSEMFFTIFNILEPYLNNNN